jgi:phytoene desaturase
MPVFPFYRLLWEDGYVFDYTNTEELFDQIQKKSPEDVEGYKRFLSYSKDVFNEGYTKLVAVPFLNWWQMVQVSPQLIRLAAYRPVFKTVASFIKDKHLRQAFSFHSLLVGGNPFKTSSIYTLIHYLERNWGVFFPKGGTGALVNAMVRLFKDLGGNLVLNSEVDEILTNSGQVQGVKLKSGRSFDADIVISNGDVYRTYKNLLRNEPRAKLTALNYSRMSYSMSLFLIYFGTKKKYPNLSHHNVIFGPRYKELLDDIFTKGIVADDFSLYLHVPSKTDPSLAPEGHECFYVLSPVPNLGKSKVDWKTFGPEYADKILKYLEKHYMPGLSESLVTKRIFTPEDFDTQLNSHLGAAFSVEPLLTQSAYFRPHNRHRSIKGMYIAGAGTHPGAGVPGVINSAKATVSVVLNDFEISPHVQVVAEKPRKGKREYEQEPNP